MFVWDLLIGGATLSNINTNDWHTSVPTVYVEARGVAGMKHYRKYRRFSTRDLMNALSFLRDFGEDTVTDRETYKQVHSRVMKTNEIVIKE